jgi:hypothetical protein
MTLLAALDPEEILKAKDLQASIFLTVAERPEHATELKVTLLKAPQKAECVYLVTMTKLTVLNSQSILREGLALEPFADVNAVGLGRFRSPRAGTHVLRAGQSVNVNTLFAMGFDTKGNQVNVQVIADVDEIDGPQLINPDDLRAQGQSGFTNFVFDCDNGLQTNVIPVPVIGNVMLEGNGLVEIEIEVQWDP